MKPILLYDIDGTLLNVERNFLHSIIDEQLKQLGLEKPETNESFAGRTDRGIFMEFMNGRPDREELFIKFREYYAESMEQNLKSEHVTLFDEAVESVRVAEKMGVPIGLCTGNFREVAYTKVNAAGLNGAFRFGGFGGKYADRNDLPGSAKTSYMEVFGDDPEHEQFVIIGDTPNDIRCAKHFGARVIAVTTGGFSKSELAEHNPDYIFESLAGAEEWISKL